MLLTFAIHGLFAGLAAVLYATQLSVIQSTVPPNLELTIITAAVVGGVSILGGTGTVIGATLAAVLIAAIGSSLIFVGISPYWLRAVQGLLILATVLADIYRRRRLRAGRVTGARWPIGAHEACCWRSCSPHWPCSRASRTSSSPSTTC